MPQHQTLKITATAADPKHRMTLGELRSFVRTVTDSGADDTTEVKATMTWSGYLKSVEVSG